MFYDFNIDWRNIFKTCCKLEHLFGLANKSIPLEPVLEFEIKAFTNNVKLMEQIANQNQDLELILYFRIHNCWAIFNCNLNYIMPIPKNMTIIIRYDYSTCFALNDLVIAMSDNNKLSAFDKPMKTIILNLHWSDFQKEFQAKLPNYDLTKILAKNKKSITKSELIIKYQSM